MSPRHGDDVPLVSHHPYLSAAEERANPAATTDPQVIGDLDRLQVAERELAAALAITHDVEAQTHAPTHLERAEALRRLIVELGGAPSDYGLRELPHEPEQLGGVRDRRNIYLALHDDARVLADLYEGAVEHATAVEPAHRLLEQHLIATRADVARFAARAR